MSQYETEEERLGRADGTIVRLQSSLRVAHEALTRERATLQEAVALIRYVARLRNPGYKERARKWLIEQFGEDYYMQDPEILSRIEEQENGQSSLEEESA